MSAFRGKGAALEARLIRHISPKKLDAPPSPNPERPAEIDPSGDSSRLGSVLSGINEQYWLGVLSYLCGL